MSQITAKQSGDISENALRRSSDPVVRPLHWLGAILRALPTVVVLGALGGIAAYGHSTGWRLPSSTGLFADKTPEADWCSEHSVPEAECVECIPTLLPAATDFGWCKEHGVHQCPHCHPEVAQLKQPPQVSNLQSNYISRALGAKDRQENNLGCNLYKARVQFASIDAVSKAGIDVEPAETQRIFESVSANGELTYDETRVAHISPRSEGIVWRVDKSVGDEVRQGELLALVDSTDVGNAKAALLDAMAQVDYQSQTVDRLSPLVASRAISGARVLEEEMLLKQAQIQLNRAAQTLANLGMPAGESALRQLSEKERWDAVRFLGIPTALTEELASSTATNNLIPVLAPIDGVITELHIVQGEVVSKSDMLFQVVDTNALWLRLSVALEDAKHLRLGQPVRFRPDGTKQDVPSQVGWISTNVDSSTRTVEVRCDVANTSGEYRNQTFGSGEIILREASHAVVVPKEAVQWDGSCFVVFVRDKNYFSEDHPKLFHTRSVRPGVTKDGQTEIIAGVLRGEVVATEGSSVLRAQILKNNLGAGCTCGH